MYSDSEGMGDDLQHRLLLSDDGHMSVASSSSSRTSSQHRRHERRQAEDPHQQQERAERRKRRRHQQQHDVKEEEEEVSQPVRRQPPPPRMPEVPPAAQEEEEDNEPERKETVFKSMHHFDFASYEEPQQPDPLNPNWCARCHLGIAANHANAPNKWVAVLNYIKENEGKVAKAKFVRTIQTMYIEDIQDKLVDMKGRTYKGPPWLAQEILQHDSHHTCTSKGIMREMMMSNLWTFRSIRDNETVSVTRFVDRQTGEETWKESTNTGKAMTLMKLSEKIMAQAAKVAQFENQYMA